MGRTGLRVLECLARSSPQLVVRDELISYGWEGTAVGDASLAKQVRLIREALGDKDRTLVLTHHGQGFSLDSEVTSRVSDGRVTGRDEALALPERPYPLLRPYTHRALFAGREQEVEQVLARLRGQIPILGFYSAAGMGKSSVLRAGVMPALREAGVPVAYYDHPGEPGALQTVAAQLPGWSLKDEDDYHEVFAVMAFAAESADPPPVVVLDQFEDVLKLPAGHPARARWGVALAASLRGHTAISKPSCRWVLAYRAEYEGRVKPWLGDVLDDARRAGLDELGGLPSDLSHHERFESLWLAPFGASSTDEGTTDAARRAFLRAIQKPLEITENGRLRYGWSFEEEDANRVARAFAEERLRQPEAPLVPQLQVVLAYLLSTAGAPAPGETVQIRVTEGEVETLVEKALERHLRRALLDAFPGDSQAALELRGHALLALRQLATAKGERGRGLRANRLEAALGPSGDQVLDLLAAEELRLLTPRQGTDGLRYELSHDTLAQVIVEALERDPTLGGEVDGDLVGLRRIMALRTEQFGTEEKEQATRLPRAMFAAISEHRDALLWTPEQEAWWQACVGERRRRVFRYRFIALIGILAMAVTSIGVLWANRSIQRTRLIQEVTAAEPPVALHALINLDDATWSDPRLAEALEGRRFARLLEEGILAIPREERDLTVLRLVSAAEARLRPEVDGPEFINLGAALWSLDAYPGRNAALAERANELKRRLLAPLGEPPKVPAQAWACVQGGSFLMGSEEPDRTRYKGKADTRLHRVSVSSFQMLKHEVTNEELRTLQPERLANRWPAGEASWYEAAVFAAWIGGRLPTEAEWEYAARGPSARRFPWGNEEPDCSRARFEECQPEEAIQVCQLEAGNTPEGICDLAGNLWEWVADWYGDGEYPEEEEDPWGLDSSSARRVFRGGAFDQSAVTIRSSFRLRGVPRSKAKYMGFRVVVPGPC